ncbi:hypothetical protein [Alkalicoccus daliensis]|uniref:EVE domain-containing protein n=1 Tax=Alkalicoccus daliensis TaxID=745820 RepID=A0A1H0G9W2_9BACI|nr:hypothetical protein [Alkalicoccus daliensis]SDO03638.1 hypothetical protein SAMN04488053_10629 [Alkalicoccus daliensis]
MAQQSSSYLLNTNFKYNPEAHEAMLREGKAAAFYSPWKEKIERIQEGDRVFLYQSGTGIVAVGIGSGILDTQEYRGDPEEEYFTPLDQFHILKTPLSAPEMRQAAQSQFMFAQTMIALKQAQSDRLWNYIQENRL